MLKDEHLWTVEDAAKYLGVTTQTVYKWVKKGEIPAIRVNRFLRFSQSEIDEHLKKEFENGK